MTENTTDGPVSVVGQPHEHPAIRRLARACLALARWQRRHDAGTPPPTTGTQTPEVGVRS